MRLAIAMGLICMLAAAGCGDDDDDAADGSVTSDAATNTHKASGILQDSVTVLPITGMQVCILEYPAVPCGTSNATGRYDIPGVPNGAKYHLLLTKTGYYSKLFVVAPRSTDITMNIVMQTNEVVASWFTQLGISNDTTKAIVSTQVTQGASFVGSTFALSPMPAGSTGPGYGKPDFSFDPALTSTTASGVGGFLNVPPGDYQITVTPPTGTTCSTVVAGALPMSAAVLARAGVITHIGFKCE